MGEPGMLLTVVPLRGQCGHELDACGHFAPNAPLPAQTARPYCFDGLPHSTPAPPRTHCAAGRLAGHLLLELTLWSRPRVQEPFLLQQFA